MIAFQWFLKEILFNYEKPKRVYESNKLQDIRARKEIMCYLTLHPSADCAEVNHPFKVMHNKSKFHDDEKEWEKAEKDVFSDMQQLLVDKNTSFTEIEKKS